MAGKYQAYPEYKDSGVEWLGDVPEHWQLNRFKNIFRIRKRIAGKLGFDILSITQKGVKIKDTESGDGQLSMDYSKYQLVYNGDYAMNHMDLLTGFVDISKFDGVTSPDYRVFTLEEKNSNKSYYLYLLQLCYIAKIFYPLGQGAANIGRWRLPAETFNEFLAPLPAFYEQTKIANFLDHETVKIDTLIEKQQQLIQLLKEKRQAVISHAVTKGLNPDVPMRDSGVEWLGEVPEHWDIMQLRRITYLQQGLQIPQENRFFEEGENRVEYITIKSINSGSDRTHKEFIESPSIRVVCKETDILLSRTGATGEVVTNVSGAFHNNFFKVNYLENKIIRDYLVYFLKVYEVKNHLLMLAGTTTIPDLNHGAFLSTLICIPDKNEQYIICKYLDRKLEHYDYMINQVYKLIELMQERRTALISAAVTGKIDVRNWQPPKTSG